MRHKDLKKRAIELMDSTPTPKLSIRQKALDKVRKIRGDSVSFRTTDEGYIHFGIPESEYANIDFSNSINNDYTEYPGAGKIIGGIGEHFVQLFFQNRGFSYNRIFGDMNRDAVLHSEKDINCEIRFRLCSSMPLPKHECGIYAYQSGLNPDIFIFGRVYSNYESCREREVLLELTPEQIIQGWIFGWIPKDEFMKIKNDRYGTQPESYKFFSELMYQVEFQQLRKMEDLK